MVTWSNMSVTVSSLHTARRTGAARTETAGTSLEAGTRAIRGCGRDDPDGPAADRGAVGLLRGGEVFPRASAISPRPVTYGFYTGRAVVRGRSTSARLSGAGLWLRSFFVPDVEHICGHLLALALELERRRASLQRRRAQALIQALGDHDLAGLRGRLQAGGGIDNIPER